MAVVRPELQFGITELGEDGHVTGFREKPRSEHWINGGFFFFEEGVFDYLARTACSSASRWSGSPPTAAAGLPPRGFWECMDTYKDAVDAERPVGAGRAVEAVELSPPRTSPLRRLPRRVSGPRPGAEPSASCVSWPTA